MSKLYKKYLDKKKEDSDKIYLFKKDFLYIFREDAKIMSEELGLKLSKFSQLSDKCGFPIKELDKYMKFIKLLNYECEVIMEVEDYVINDILKTENITANEALSKINKYREMICIKVLIKKYIKINLVDI